MPGNRRLRGGISVAMEQVFFSENAGQPHETTVMRDVGGPSTAVGSAVVDSTAVGVAAIRSTVSNMWKI